jgi:serine/threonine protein phosphatase PrpC
MSQVHQHDDPDRVWSAVRTAYVADTMNAKCRQSMEDAHVLVDAFNGVSTDAFFGVYDGHGGRGVVEFVERRLADNVARELSFDPKRTPAECVTCAYLVTDIESRKAGLCSSGCTAVTCLVTTREGRRWIYCANVGDARIVVSERGGGARRMTFDHKATDPGEKKRIEEAGGFVMRSRVLGMLAVSRSFGDHGLKQFVSARPHTEDMCVDDADFMILACDGLWDVIDDADAVEMVRRSAAAAEADCARALVDAALEKGSTDNITVMVVFF